MELVGIESLCLRLGYEFHDPSILSTALTHKSYTNENPGEAPEHNERLEFLGDAVLDFVISDLLMEHYPHLPEGDLSKMRAGLVSESALAVIARELELGSFLRMGRGERLSGGMDKDSILSDALEALFAAVYLDSAADRGVSEVVRVVRRIFAGKLLQAGQGGNNEDYKTELQELMQSRYKEVVQYLILQEKGPDHDKEFQAAVMFRDRELGRGKGRSKKQAEQDAARLALQNERLRSGNL